MVRLDDFGTNTELTKCDEIILVLMNHTYEVVVLNVRLSM